MSEKSLEQVYFKIEPNLILDASGNNLSHCPIPLREKRGMVAHYTPRLIDVSGEIVLALSVCPSVCLTLMAERTGIQS